MGGFSVSETESELPALDLRLYNRVASSKYDYSKLYQKILSYIANEDINYIVLMGEYRVREQILLAYAQLHKIPVHFWEVGAPGYIYFSNHGTNANAKFHLNSKYQQDMRKFFKEVRNKQTLLHYQEKLSSKLFKAVELLYLNVRKYIVRNDEFDEFIPQINLSMTKYSDDNIKPTQRMIVFYGQVQKDVNSTILGLQILIC